MAALIHGCDVSSLQGQCNFTVMKNSGLEFVIARNGIGNSSCDPSCSQNIKGAQNAGMKASIYNFIYPLPTNGNNSRDPKAQAAYHFAAAPKDVVAFCDLEWPAVGDWSKWGVDSSFIVDWLLNYLEAYDSLSGQTTHIYSYAPFMQSLGLANCPEISTNRKLWLAAYCNALPACPKPFNTVSIWQNSGSARVCGCSTTIDTDIAYDMSIFDMTTNVSTNDPVIQS